MKNRAFVSFTAVPAVPSLLPDMLWAHNKYSLNECLNLPRTKLSEKKHVTQSTEPKGAAQLGEEMLRKYSGVVRERSEERV